MRKRDLHAVVAVFVAALALCWQSAGRAADLPRATPETLGFSSDRLYRIDAMLEDAVRGQQIPGAQLLIARHGKIGYFRTIGDRDPATKAPLTEDSIFRIYSMSKPITVVAALM